MEKFVYLPEKALGIAIIVRAIKDALGIVCIGKGKEKASKEKRYRREALAWLFTLPREHGYLPMSFGWWCEHIGVDQGSIRRYVLRGMRPKEDVNVNCELTEWLEFLDQETTAPYKIVV